jgi:hypothetical protein
MKKYLTLALATSIVLCGFAQAQAGPLKFLGRVLKGAAAKVVRGCR